MREYCAGIEWQNDPTDTHEITAFGILQAFAEIIDHADVREHRRTPGRILIYSRDDREQIEFTMRRLADPRCRVETFRRT
jgi:hypothetical protein